MKALLLAAGLGTRLRPITDTVPKCLVPIHGKPLLGYWFDLLFAAGIEGILVNTHYFAEAVRSFVAAGPYRDRVVLAHEPELLGTAGTLLANRDFFGKEPVLLAHADNLSQFDVTAFRKRHDQRPADAVLTMMTFDTDVPHSCGIVEEDSNGLVVAFHEKVVQPPGTRANGAVYIVEDDVVRMIDSLGKPVVDFSTEVIPHFLGRICTFHNGEYHRDIGTPESLAQAEIEFARFLRPNYTDNAT